MSEALRHGGPEADGVDVSMLKHISPIEWSNVLLYGQYVIDRNLIRRRRPPSPSRRRWRCDSIFTRMWFLHCVHQNQGRSDVQDIVGSLFHLA